jgi:phospholipase/carboxylesterase
LSQSLAHVGSIVDGLMAQRFEPGRIVLMGFSQGGCLALEFAARNPRNYGAVIGLSAGLIGPDGMVRQDRGSLAGTRVLLGCSDIDPHIPLARVYESARVLAELGADVDARIYPVMDHTINEDEVARTRALIARLGRATDAGHNVMSIAKTKGVDPPTGVPAPAPYALPIAGAHSQHAMAAIDC